MTRRNTRKRLEQITPALRGFFTLSLAASLSLPVMADFRPLDDSTLGNVTGQTGVTIEMETKVEMDRLSWTDEGSLNVMVFACPAITTPYWTTSN